MASPKARLRTQLRAARAARPAEERLRYGLALALAATPLLRDLSPGASVAAFLSTASEPQTDPLIERPTAAGVRVLLPVPVADGALGWAGHSGSRRPHPGLPVEVPVGPVLGVGIAPLVERGVALVLVPALAVDQVGHRLGQGGGFYDRLLSDLPATITTIAVVHEDEVLPVVPLEPHDVPVQGALTPCGLIWFDTTEAPRARR